MIEFTRAIRYDIDCDEIACQATSLIEEWRAQIHAAAAAGQIVRVEAMGKTIGYVTPRFPWIPVDNIVGFSE